MVSCNTVSKCFWCFQLEQTGRFWAIVWRTMSFAVGVLSMCLCVWTVSKDVKPVPWVFWQFVQSDFNFNTSLQQGDMACNQGPCPTKLPDCTGSGAWSALCTCTVFQLLTKLLHCRVLHLHHSDFRTARETGFTSKTRAPIGFTTSYSLAAIWNSWYCRCLHSCFFMWIFHDMFTWIASSRSIDFHFIIFSHDGLLLRRHLH